MRLIILAATAALVLAAPAQTWVARYDGTGDEDATWGIASDGAGNVFVTGASWSAGTSYDFATVGYNSSGETLWVRRFDGAESGVDEARAVAAAPGRAVVTGGSADTSLFSDILTVAYDGAGDTLWTATFAGPAGRNDQGLAAALDGAGNVYVTGYATFDTSGWDYATIKYDAGGNRQWVGRYTTEFEDFASDIALDAAGNVYVTGSTGNPYLLTWDYATVKYDSAGVEQWTARYDGPGIEDDEPAGLVVDDAGNVYVTGGSLGVGTNMDFATVKYDAGGETLWVRRLEGPAGGADEATGVALAPSGNIVVTGFSEGDGTSTDFLTVSYSPAGTELWTARYDGPDHDFDEARAVAVDAAGNAYVTGVSWGDRYDYLTVKYDSEGREQWVERYDGPDDGFDEPVGVALDGAAGVCVAGRSDGVGTGVDFATCRYLATGIEEKAEGGFPRLKDEGGRMNQTVVRGTLFWSATTPSLRNGGDIALHSPDGRRVMNLAPGANDVS
ncbi:SBBP repeat-containing protein, partial [candidate division WOR-3 bacterium]|nr:SBBP repeat-containing protein [candidate division WOR-3 bacterium]